MQIHELESGDKFKVIDSDVRVPPAALEPNSPDTVYKYSHLDGMYCTAFSNGQRYYFAAWTEVEKVK